MKKLGLLVGLALLAGCVSVTKEKNWQVAESDSKEIQIYRPSGSHSKAIKVYFGSEENYVIGLKEKQFALVRVPFGEQTFRVAPSGSASHSIKTLVSENSENCYAIRANNAAWAAAAIPILAAGIPSFKISEDSCLTEEQKQEHTLAEGKL